jgi:Methyltransferase domain
MALRLARCFDEIVGVDADEAMIDQARRNAATDGIGHARFRCMRAESLPADLGQFRVAALALAFHWFDQPRVAAALMRMLEPGGACICVYAWTLRGDAVRESANPRPPYAQMARLASHYLGPAGTVKHPVTPSVTPGDEAAALTAAGFSGPQITIVGGGEVVTTTIDDIIARYFSTSGASPDVFGSQLPDYERDARALLSAATPSGHFTEQLRDLQLNVWTKQPRQ